jgi:hypothetical protein
MGMAREGRKADTPDKKAAGRQFHFFFESITPIADKLPSIHKNSPLFLNHRVKIDRLGK